MEKTDGESSRSGGQPCPPLQKLQGVKNKSAGPGGELQDFHTTLTKLAAVIQCLKEQAESAPVGARVGRASAVVRAGLKFVAVMLLATGVGYGLGDGDLFDDVGPGVAQQPSRPVHRADARQAAEQAGSKSHGSAGGADSGSDGGGAAGQPECVARAKACVFRLPDGRCQATEQPCRLCETHGSLDDIRAMLGEIRAGVMGLAMGPPLASVANKNIHTIGRFQYGAGFMDVWLGGEHFDLRGRAKARFCLQYLVAKKAFDPDSARHLENEIDPFVRKKCGLPPPSEIRIQHYFNDGSGKLSRLRSDLVKAAGRNGRFYLQVV